MVELLLSGTADVNLVNNAGMTPLMFAAQRGYRDIVERLLARGGDVNLRANSGATALTLAVVGGYRDVVHMLLEQRADPNARQGMQDSPVLIAARKAWEALAAPDAARRP